MPTNVSTSFFFINLLFQARRAGSNPRPSCILRCVAARDKLRPWRRAMARAHQEGCARSRPSAWVLNSRCVAVRDKSRPWRRAMARAHQEGCARARPSAWVFNSRCVAARDKSRPGRRAYGSCSSRELRTCAAQCLGSQFAVRGRTGQVAPGAAGLWLVLIERVVYGRGVWLVGDWKGLAMGGVWPGAVHLDWSKSPRWMGARRCAGVSLPGRAGRKQFWAELFPR